MKTLQQTINEEAKITLHSSNNSRMCEVKGGSYKNFKDILDQINDPTLTSVDIRDCEIMDGSDFDILIKGLPSKCGIITIMECSVKNFVITGAPRNIISVVRTKIIGNFTIKGHIHILGITGCDFDKCTRWFCDQANIEILEYHTSFRKLTFHYNGDIEGDLTVGVLNCGRKLLPEYGQNRGLYAGYTYQELKKNTQEYFHAKKISVSHWND